MPFLETRIERGQRLKRERRRKGIKTNREVASIETRRLVAHEFLQKKGCKACPYEKRRLDHPRMKPTGAKHPLVYVLGEAPGEEEDQQGEQFIGPAGKTLRKAIPRRWLKRIRFDNCIRCMPPNNRTPRTEELECCRMRVVKSIERAKPKAIIGTGNVPLDWMIGRTGIKAWRGRRLPVRVGDHKCWYYPILHPSYINRVKGKEDDKRSGDDWAYVFKRDIHRVFLEINDLDYADPLDLSTLDGGLVLLQGGKRDLKAVKETLLAFAHKSPLVPIAVDIETVGLRPYSQDAQVLCVALSDGEKTIAFPIDHRGAKWTGKQKRLVLQYLEAFIKGSTIKVAHSAPFEMEWFVWMFDETVLLQEWEDSMVQAYVLDDRRQGQALNDLTLTHFGFALKDQMKVDRGHLADLPLDILLRYNALDAKYTHPIFLCQEERIKEQDLMGVYELQRKRLPSLVMAQAVGIVIDQNEVMRYDAELMTRMTGLRRKIDKMSCVVKYKREFGNVFNPLSPPQVAVLLVEICGHKRGRDHKFSVGKDVLLEIDTKFSRAIVRLRELRKLHSTYVVGLLPGGKSIYSDGRVHTKFNTTFTVTGRLSSDDPNLQNIPIRTEDGRRVRKAFAAPLGYLMVGSDYGQIEVCIIAEASKDKFLIKGLRDRWDVHLYWAERIAEVFPKHYRKHRRVLEKEGKDTGTEAVIMHIRSEIKTDMVFPLYYGSTAAAIAAVFGVSVNKFRPVYDEFWDMFGGVKAWQDAEIEFYVKHGYTVCLTGRRRWAPLSHNMILNSSIQGTASDVTVDAGDRLHGLAMRGKPWLQFVINVHDDLEFYVPENNLDEACTDIVGEMLDIPFDWLTVPISVEVVVGKNWYEREKVGIFYSDE